MAVVFEKTKGLTDAKLHYCPGCAHGIVHRLVAEVLEEMGELGNSIVAVPVGCAVFANNYFNIDAIQCAHGRAPATATREYTPNRQYLHIRAMVTLLPSVHVKSFMQQRVVKRLQQSSSTTVSTA